MVLEIPDFLKPFFLGGYPWCGNLRFPYEDDYLDPLLPCRELLAGRQSWLVRSWKWTSSFWDMSRSPFLGEVHHTSPKKKMSRNSFYPTWCPQRCLISPSFWQKSLAQMLLPVNFQRVTIRPCSTKALTSVPSYFQLLLTLSLRRSMRWWKPALSARSFRFFFQRCGTKHRDWGFLK